MTPLSLRQLPARPLAELASESVVVLTGAIGYLDAAEEDRRRYAAGFRALLDGLDAPLQVVVDFAPAEPAGGPAPEPATAGAPLPFAPSAPPEPPPGDRRRLDLAFAEALRRRPGARRRVVHLVTRAGSAQHLLAALRDMAVPDVAVEQWSPPAGLGVGREHAGALEDGGGWHRTFFMQRFPGTELEPGWLLRLVPPGVRATLAWHAEPLPTAWVVDWLQRQLVNMRATQLQKAGGLTDPQLTDAVPAAEALQRRLTGSRESAFHVSLYLTVGARSREELQEAAERVESAARSTLAELGSCDFRQLDGRLATLPLGRDPLRRHKVLDTSALVTLFPWFDADLQQPGGLVVGHGRATGQPVLVDPFDDRRHANANIGVFGHSGAGKTYLLSTLAMSALSLGAQVFVIDPEHEYGRLATRLGGADVQLALGSDHSLNVLDLHGVRRDETALGPAVADAVDLCAVICGGLDQPERALLEAAVRRAYESVARPVLGDVAELLDPNTRLAAVLVRWVRGSLGRMFSRPTTVDLEAPLVVFGMRELRPEMVAPLHYLLAQALWARIKVRDRRRVLLIDELGLLFEDPTIRRFVVALARRIRKYEGALVFATQNPGDLLGSEAGAVVASNPALHFFGTQRPGEAARLQHAFHFSDAQRARLETARRGEFLLTAGADRVFLHVEAPPWQVTAMKRSRHPPS